ncbi:hypothetical protein PVAP13_5NG130600 [Panicum virgatum]|uniref:SIAH-type domain-containing protein n=1 Tax=Panicum virgatum TaxID=38727 RepID=A0A8T0RMP4_PANVG|nr:hypothetical protein PVAP13_5NG130600 [Panicum virgatum]
MPGTWLAATAMASSQRTSATRAGTTAPTAYRRNTTLEDVVGWHRVLCPNAAYGCQAYVPYHECGDHQRECPCAPCGCSESGCSFAGSPPMLRDHLRDAHGWPVDKIRYGSPHDLCLPESQRRRLLVAEEDGRVFIVVAVGAPGECHEVSLACLRANAAAGPQCTCRMLVIGKAAGAASAPSVMMKMAGCPARPRWCPWLCIAKCFTGPPRRSTSAFASTRNLARDLASLMSSKGITMEATKTRKRGTNKLL